MSEYQATIYGRPGCTKCRATERAIRKMNIPLTIANIDQHPFKLELIQDMGWAELPPSRSSHPRRHRPLARHEHQAPRSTPIPHQEGLIMAYNHIIIGMTDEDLRAELIGQTVTAINENNNTLTLGNGTILTFIDTSDCCAWFEAQLTAGNLTDNAITAVNCDSDSFISDGPGSFTIHILAADQAIADLSVEGDATSGYYCHSIDLGIKYPDKDAA